jgi:hypothetical protein
MLKFTPQAKAAMRINLVLLITFCSVNLLSNLSVFLQFSLGFAVGVLNYLYVVNQINKANFSDNG